jgi:hypothetical protein
VRARNGTLTLLALPLRAAGPAGIAWLYPLITDGLALVAYAATVVPAPLVYPLALLEAALLTAASVTTRDAAALVRAGSHH